MKQLLALFLCSLWVAPCLAQVQRDTIQTQNDSITIVDHNYREDQFYVSVTYNLLSKTPDGLAQRGFSSGFHLGFIRDFPINERRNVAIGVGLGLSSNSYNQNMLIAEQPNGTFSYEIIDGENVSFDKNKFTTYLVEMPLEFRFRTSTAVQYRFWRVYAGVKLGYVLYGSSKFDGSTGRIKNAVTDEMDRFRYGLTLSAGYATWNAHIYYGLNDIFGQEATIDGQPVNMRSIKIGLMFYIL